MPKGPLENPTQVSATIGVKATPSPAKQPVSITKKTLQLFARWVSPPDPNHNTNPVQSTSGHALIPTPWGFAPATVEAQQLCDPNRYNLNWDFEYRVRPAFSPGTGYFAYGSFGLYEQTAIGAGVANRMQFRSMQPPPLYMPVKSLAPIGLPHDAGEVALQGLAIDNPDLQGYIG